MEDEVKSLNDYFSIGWRRKYYILIPFFLVLIVASTTIFVLPSIYSSTGTILVESQQISEKLVESAVTGLVEERIQTISQQIMSSQQLFEIIEKFNLNANQDAELPRSKILNDVRERINIAIVSIGTKRRRRNESSSVVFTISFEDTKPQIAQSVANELVTLFLDENIRSRTESAEGASEFLKKEVERLGTQITAIGEKIALYKQKNEASLPEALQINLERMVNLKSELLNSENELSALDEKRNLLIIDIETLRIQPSGEGVGSEKLALKQELKELQNQVVALSARYGPDHPDVKAANRQLVAFESEYGILSSREDLLLQKEQVETEIREQLSRYSKNHPNIKRLERKLEGIVLMIGQVKKVGVTTQAGVIDPELRQAKARLESTLKAIDRLKRSRLSLENQILLLDKQISRTPQVERGLEALERDYENTKQKYREIKSKQLQAELSRSLEEDQKGQRFTLVQPPLLPDSPIKPNRPVFLLVGLAFSLMCGVVVAGVAEVFDRGIQGPRALATVTKMTPLVTIPYISTSYDEKTRILNIWMLVVSVLMIILGIIVVLHLFYKPIDILWLSLLQKLSLL
jgi:uncharacterized protein involved in exopolysaccharide biosynthesis